ncbi:DEAD/DEAH box helicase [Aeoliella mucimassa]|uniref:Putative ATP-dependent helicase Lhr n=1 Tax=Aeoliella mucimassa TaxID=2527972 RepID=A0A518AUL9_9BACT|nr:DEAD/DEAH box helicase [Aeoliella mucimassa]QDU58414.1 putative ATP-dependent helicase Lhr [Aeoliella mucimassa]
MDVEKLLERMQSRRDYAGQLEHLEHLPAREGQYAEPSKPLSPLVASLLDRHGIESLYTHQVESLEAARNDRDMVVVTGTASGKTLCYNLPILEAVTNDFDARALYLFPTKALAQDQLKGLLSLVQGDQAMAARVRPGVYDGDTPTAQRRRIRNEANLVLTNPDMLHAGILPYHPKWATLFADLRYIVIDEVHTYRGILGAHVAAVLRRIDRICRHYGSNPVYLSASATIANPGELVSDLLGRDVQVIDNDGSPRGRKFFALWNPMPLGTDALARRSANDDAVSWLTESMEAGGQALAFTRTRQAAELVHRYAKRELETRHSPLAEQVRAYRGGYLPNERREMEQDLFAGRLRGVATTNALELGIDIGSLDVAILVGYPGTIASCWQQAGRSGRRADDSLAVLLAGNEPVDQYLLRHPQYFFAQSPEHAVVDANNPYVLAKHLKAAAFELPLTAEDLQLFGPLAEPIAEVLRDENQLTQVEEQYFCPGGQNPAVGVSLRHMSDNTFSIVCIKHQRISRDLYTSGSPPLVEQGHEVIANVDAISAPELVYPEAVYLHGGDTFLVRELDLNGKVAYVERRETDYYTQAVLESNVLITSKRDECGSQIHGEVGYGELDVSWQTVAFKKIKFETRENIGLGPVDIPAQNLATTGTWVTPNDAVRATLKGEGLRASEGVCGMRNLAVVALPLVAMCDSRDLGGVVDAKNLGRSSMILYDRYPGGLGYCQKGFDHILRLLEICLEMVADCPCDDGCPSCVGLPNLRPAIHSDPDLTRGHPIPNKQATRRLLELLLGCDTTAAEPLATTMIDTQ